MGTKTESKKVKTKQGVGVDVNDVVIYAAYADDGPNGMCGQAMSITSKWNKLHIFHDHEKFRLFVEGVENTTTRKNARIEWRWIKDGLSEDVVEHI